jgi:hypothetical protein
MVPLVVERQAAVAVRGLPSAVTRAPAAGAYLWSEAIRFSSPCTCLRSGPSGKGGWMGLTDQDPGHP